MTAPSSPIPDPSSLVGARLPRRWQAWVLRCGIVVLLGAMWWWLLSTGFGRVNSGALGSHPLRLLAAVFGLFWLLLTTLRVGLWFFYRPTPPTDDLPDITAVVPAFNEGAEVRSALLSLVHSAYPADKLRVIAVDDGSQDDTLHHLNSVAALFPERVRVLRLPINSGKRAALRAGFVAAQSEIIVTVDSDSVVAPEALHHLVAPLRDPRIASVSGRLIVQNREASIVTRLLCPWFKLVCDYLRGAQSVNGTVICCAGPLSAHRATAVREVLDAWMDQRFLGSKVGPGEDHHLTTLFLRRGYRTVYQRTANVHTRIPSSYAGVCRMYLRWGRTDLRESVGALRWWSPTPGRSRLRVGLLLASALETLLSVPIGVLWLWSFVALAASQPMVLLTGLVLVHGPVVLALLLGMSSELSADTLLLWGCYAAFPAMAWITPYAALTINDQAWMSRQRPAGGRRSVGAAEPPPQPVNAPEGGSPR